MLKCIDRPIEKRYFKTEEVAEACGITASAVRYKADKIGMQVRRGARGARLFTVGQLEAFKAMYKKPVVVSLPKRPHGAWDEAFDLVGYGV